MKIITRIKTILLAIYLMPTFAQSADLPTQFQGDAESQANCQRMTDQITQNRQQRIQELIPKPANESFSTGTCLDGIMNTRINIFTISLDGILDRIMNAAKNQACSAVMGAWNQAIGNANRALGTTVNVPYAGNILTVRAGQGVGTPININNGQGLPNITPATVAGATPGFNPQLPPPVNAPAANQPQQGIGQSLSNLLR